MQRLKRKLTESVLLERTEQNEQKRAKRKSKIPKKNYWKYDFGDPTIWQDDVWMN